MEEERYFDKYDENEYDAYLDLALSTDDQDVAMALELVMED